MGDTPRSCARCGLTRPARKQASLCADCKYVLSTEEWRFWLTPGQAVELSHETEAA